MNILLGENLKKLRREREITQEELANVLGTSPQSVSNWERGDCYPDMELVPRIARYFAVTLDDLFGMSDVNDAERIAALEEQSHNIFMTGSPEEIKRITELWRELARDLPNNFSVQLGYARQLIVQSDTADDIVANGCECARVCEYVLDECTDSLLRMQADSILVRAYSQAKQSQKAYDHAQRLHDYTSGRENAMKFLIDFDDGYRTIVSHEQTTQVLHYQALTATLVLGSVISTLMGEFGSSGFTEPINYLEGEAYADLVAEYQRAREMTSRLMPMIQARLNGAEATFGDDGSVSFPLYPVPGALG